MPTPAAGRLHGRRVLVSSADRYMGPAITERFRHEGARVVADTRDLVPVGAAADAVAAAHDELGGIDVLVANLATAPRPALAHEIADDDWHALFDELVHPLMRLVRASLPSMVEAGAGKVVAVTSAAPLRGIPMASAYCAARGAQNAFLNAVGLEVARHNVQVNAIGQNYVRNNVYYPDEMLADDAMRARMEKAVPAGRLAEGWETAELAVYLASEASGFLAGQVIPFAGGWVT